MSETEIDAHHHEVESIVERITEECEIYQNSPSITVEYRFTVPSELVQEVRDMGRRDHPTDGRDNDDSGWPNRPNSDAPMRVARNMARQTFREEYNDVGAFIGSPTIIVEQLGSGADGVRRFKAVVKR